MQTDNGTSFRHREEGTPLAGEPGRTRREKDKYTTVSLTGGLNKAPEGEESGGQVLGMGKGEQWGKGGRRPAER